MVGGLGDSPHLAEIATRLPETGYDAAAEFECGLELILDGLERLRGEGGGAS